MSKLEKILKENPNYQLLGKTKPKKKLEYEGITKEEIDSYFNP
jgi:hypothetical protein